MRKELELQYEKELIYEICCTIKGVGGTTAGAVAEYFSSLSDFLGSGRRELKKIVNAKKNSILSDDRIDLTMSVKSEIVKGTSIPETWVFFLAKSFIRSQVKMLAEMEFTDLDINPLLAKALDLRDPKDIIRFNMYQSVTRSIVTSWGSTVEKMLKYSGCESEKIKVGIKGREPDIVKKIGEKTYCFQVKSGPNTMNVDMVESLNKVIEELEKKGCIGMLGMTYGKRSKISQQILGNLNNAVAITKIGRELWDFIAECTDYHKKLIKIIESATRQELKKSFIDIIEAKIDTFSTEWKTRYKGMDVNLALEEYM